MIIVDVGGLQKVIFKVVVVEGVNFCVIGDIKIGIMLDECICFWVLEVVWCVFGGDMIVDEIKMLEWCLFEKNMCKIEYLMYLIFYMNCVESEMMCYICCFVDCDLVFDCVMILFGFCMMKFNVIVEMLLIIWLEFVEIYFFVLDDQMEGYCVLIVDLEVKFCQIIGYDVFFMQLNFGV